jgi:hypothetical protein
MGAGIAGNATLIPAYVFTATRPVFLFCAFRQDAVIALSRQTEGRSGNGYAFGKVTPRWP